MLWLLLALAYPLVVVFVCCLLEGGWMKEDPRFDRDKIISRTRR
jgi:hypothetical protein